MTRRNRVDPWGDLFDVPSRGLFTGNRGCLVDNDRTLRRHHGGSLWIICRLRFRNMTHPLDAPRTWTPLFFLDEAVALAAGHRPCGFCRRDDYLSYRDAVTRGAGLERPVLAVEMNSQLATERLRPGRGMVRSPDRITWSANIDDLPPGTVIVDQHGETPQLITTGNIQPFSFGGWGQPAKKPTRATVRVLTPHMSVRALTNGFTPRLHPSAATEEGPGMVTGAFNSPG